MNILMIPTTDWKRHPVPNRTNFIFDRIAKHHKVHVLWFKMKQFDGMKDRKTNCILHNSTVFNVKEPSSYYILNSLNHFLEIKKIIKENKIDIIISANILPSFLANFSGKPIVYDYLDHFEESASIYYPNSFFGKLVKSAVRKIVDKNLKNAELVTTITPAFKEFLNKKGIKKVEVICNGADTSLLRPIETNKAKKLMGVKGTILGYIGSLEHWLDLETVIESLPELSKKIKDIKLMIVGPALFTDYPEKLRKLVEKLGVKDKVIFTGAVDHSEAYKYISAMDLCLNPRKPIKLNTMTIGGKVFNYLACGKPVISSNMDSLKEIGTEKEGLYFFEGKKDFIKSSLKILKIKHNSKKYRELALKYSWDNISKQYEKCLDGVMNNEKT